MLPLSSSSSVLLHCAECLYAGCSIFGNLRLPADIIIVLWLAVVERERAKRSFERWHFILTPNTINDKCIKCYKNVHSSDGHHSDLLQFPSTT